jgi:hypothetical protein
MPVEALSLTPDADQWICLARHAFDRLSPQARLFRLQLGLPADRPLVMSGHQAGLWHPGILAKHLALRHLARHGLATAWLVVDQDPEPDGLGVLRVPVRRAAPDPDDEPSRTDPHTPRWPRWSVATIPIAPEPVLARLRLEHAPAAIPSFPVRLGEDELTGAIPEGWALPQVLHAPLRRIAARWPEPRPSLSAARQAALAAQALAGALLPGPGHDHPLVFASTLTRTDFFTALLHRIAQDPLRCVELYNRALEASPDARLAPLSLHPAAGRAELPLWFIDPASGERRRVTTRTLPQMAPPFLAPRALLMTLALRMGACDLFIHGLGGGATPSGGRAAPDAAAPGYDRATERWAASWLGVALAPAVACSATMLLPLENAPPGLRAEAARAQWLAAHARHDPRLLGEPGAQGAARALARLIESRRTPRHLRRTLYRRLQELRLEARRAHPERLDQLRRQAVEARRRLRDERVIGDRTWAFALFPAEELAALDALLAERITPARRPAPSPAATPTA